MVSLFSMIKDFEESETPRRTIPLLAWSSLDANTHFGDIPRIDGLGTFDMPLLFLMRIIGFNSNPNTLNINGTGDLPLTANNGVTNLMPINNEIHLVAVSFSGDFAGAVPNGYRVITYRG